VLGPLRLGFLGSALLFGAATVRAEAPPAVVVLVLDTSGSLSAADVEAARQLGLGILRALPGGSQAAVIAFADESRLLLDRTSDAAAVERAIAALRPQGRRTALFDALYDASRYLREAPATRRAIVLLTDGRDTGSALSVEDGLKVAQETHIPVFCVGVGKVDERVLRRVAKLTSGDYAPISETTGGSLASRIFEAAAIALPKEVPSPTASARAEAAPPAPVAAAAAPARSPLSAGLFLVLVALAGVLVAILVVRSRSKRVVPPQASRRSPEARRDKSSETIEADVPATILSRLDLGNETVEGTVVLYEQPVLEITAGPAKGRVFPLSVASATSMGRARANDIVLDDEAVSGQHARIRPEDGRFVLHDLGSTNGTKVNDRKISRHILQDGDVIRAGDSSLRFKLNLTR
jgi:hypothetical protein